MIQKEGWGDAAPSAVACLIESAGLDEFPTTLLPSLRALGIAPTHCSIFRYDEDFRPSHVETATEDVYASAYGASTAYVDKLFSRDPLRELFRTISSQSMSVHRLLVDNIPDAIYRETCFKRISTVEKVSIINRKSDRCTALNLYRNNASGRFREKEMRLIEHYAPILAALADKHAERKWRTTQHPSKLVTNSEISERLIALGKNLSQREVEVCTLIILGHTSESIALNIGVQNSTILTYRKRAYEKLQISSASELFKHVLH